MSNKVLNKIKYNKVKITDFCSDILLANRKNEVYIDQCWNLIFTNSVGRMKILVCSLSTIVIALIIIFMYVYLSIVGLFLYALIYSTVTVILNSEKFILQSLGLEY